MEKPEFLAGNEKRFGNFISNLNDKDKIALISHCADLDGIVSAKVVNKVINADMIKFVDYEDINLELIKELKNNKIRKVVITDLSINNLEFIKETEKFADILIIDHHLFSNDLNSGKTVFMNSEGYCASYLCYYLFSKIQNIEKIDWLVVCASVSDWCYFKNKDFMKSVYAKYNDEFIPTIEGIRKSEKFWKIQDDLSLAIIYFENNARRVYDLIGEDFGDIGSLEKYISEVRKEIDENLDKFEKEKKGIKDGYFWELSTRFGIKSYLINVISAKIKDKTLIFGNVNNDIYTVSSRRQDGKINLPELMKKLIEGFEEANSGGHFKAAGAFVKLKNKEEFKKRLFNLR